MLGVLLVASAAVCHPALPHGPPVPAPVVLSTSCGRFVLSTDGEVNRFHSSAHSSRTIGDWRHWGHPLTVRRNRAGRFLVLRHGRLAWRSHDLYPNDGGNIAFGPHAFAFATYRRGVFLTDLESPEQLVAHGKGLYPTDFDDGGHLIVGSGKRIQLITRSGRTLRRYRYRVHNGFAYDERRNTLFFVSPGGRLARVKGTSLRLARRLSGVGGTISIDPSGPLVFSAAHGVTITRRDGAVLARASWPRSPRLASDSGVSVSPDQGAFAFRLANAHPGSRSGTATVYVLRIGASHARAIYRHRMGPSGCAVGANLTWHGRFLLYNSTDGRKVVLDTANDRALDLTRLVRRLPYRDRGETADVYWLSEFEAEYA